MKNCINALIKSTRWIFTFLEILPIMLLCEALFGGFGFDLRWRLRFMKGACYYLNIGELISMWILLFCWDIVKAVIRRIIKEKNIIGICKTKIDNKINERRMNKYVSINYRR